MSFHKTPSSHPAPFKPIVRLCALGCALVLCLSLLSSCSFNSFPSQSLSDALSQWDVDFSDAFVPSSSSAAASSEADSDSESEAVSSEPSLPSEPAEPSEPPVDYSDPAVLEALDPSLLQPGMNSGYESLSAEEKLIYAEMLDQAQNFSKTFYFANVSVDTLCAIYERMLDDHPELFYFEYSYHFLDDGGAVILATICEDDILAMGEEFRQAAEAILSEARKRSGAYAQLLYIHDALVKTAEYDEATGDRIVNEGNNFEYVPAATAYGCLVNHQAICTGYTKAFQYLAKQLGYPCRYVAGTGNGVGHAWNMVYADGAYYYVDVTWDDPTGEKFPGILHEYFCITTEQLLSDHKLDEGQDLPLCTAKNLNYYFRNGMCLDSYSFNQASKILRAQDPYGVLEICFGSSDALQAALNDLFSNNRFWEIHLESDKTSILYRYCGTILQIVFQ